MRSTMNTLVRGLAASFLMLILAAGATAQQTSSTFAKLQGFPSAEAAAGLDAGTGSASAGCGAAGSGRVGSSLRKVVRAMRGSLSGSGQACLAWQGLRSG